MCGRYSLTTDAETLAEHFQVLRQIRFQPSYKGLINQKNDLFHAPLYPLILAAFSRNIDFKFANKFLDNLLNINNMFPIIKFTLANEVMCCQMAGEKRSISFTFSGSIVR